MAELGNKAHNSKSDSEQSHYAQTVSCKKCEFRSQHIEELDVHMEQDHGRNHQQIETAGETGYQNN